LLLFILLYVYLSAEIAANVPAAWRQAGVSQMLGREQTMMFPAHFQTSHPPRLRQTARYATAFFITTLL